MFSVFVSIFRFCKFLIYFIATLQGAQTFFLQGQNPKLKGGPRAKGNAYCNELYCCNMQNGAREPQIPHNDWGFLKFDYTFLQ